MRVLFLLLCFGHSLIAVGQRKYHCEYKETIMFPMPDSLLIKFKKQMVDNGFPPESVEQIVKPMDMPWLFTSCLRKVEARPDSTFILVTKNNETEGNVKFDFPDIKLLFKKGEINRFNSDKGKFVPGGEAVFTSDDTAMYTRRIFEKSQESKVILNYRCAVYTSTDSACRIWVAEDLPDYINPGLWTGDIKGAVLAYDLKQKGQKIHAEIARIE